MPAFLKDVTVIKVPERDLKATKTRNHVFKMTEKNMLQERKDRKEKERKDRRGEGGP